MLLCVPQVLSVHLTAEVLRKKAHFSGSLVYITASKGGVCAFVDDMSEMHLFCFLSYVLSYSNLSFFPSAFDRLYFSSFVPFCFFFVYFYLALPVSLLV
jgi:hypothetical protein